MTARKRRLTIAIDTANNWSSDGQYGAVSLLSLGTTRKLHSEEHRSECLRCIELDIEWNRVYQPDGPDDVNQPARDIPRLEDLAALVRSMEIGHEWMSYDEYSRLNDVLFSRGEL